MTILPRTTRSSPCTMTDITFFFFSSRRRHTRFNGDWSSDVCSSDLGKIFEISGVAAAECPIIFAAPDRERFREPHTIDCALRRAAIGERAIVGEAEGGGAEIN